MCNRYGCFVCEEMFVSEKLHEHVDMEKHTQRELEQVVPSESGDEQEIEVDQS